MTFAAICTALGRPTVYVRRLQSQFELAVLTGDAYHAAYLEFLRGIVFLRILGVSVDRLLELWVVEKRLLTMLHVDGSNSSTWYLDACGNVSRPEQRLLLSNYDLGIPIPSGRIQLELDFSQRLSDLFTPGEMGEDVLREIRIYLRLHVAVADSVRDETAVLKAALQWAKKNIRTGA